MTPIRSTELSLRFAGEWSPAWLLVALPALAVVAALLLRGQFPELRRLRALGLAALRLGLVALVAVLVFRPDLVLTETLTWPGRVIVLVDNSASMGVADPALPAGEALRLARALDEALEPRAEHDRADALLAVGDLVARFEPVSRDGDRDADVFWNRAEAAEQEASRLLDAAGRPDILPQLAPLFGGRTHPGGRAFAEACDAVTAAATTIREEGDARDAAKLASAAPAAAALDAALAEVRGSSRSELVKRVLAQLPATLPEQRLEVVPLNETGGREPWAIAAGGTDLGGRIAGLVADPEAGGLPVDRGPINAILVVGDGRDTAAPAGPPELLLARLAERKTPVITCGVGGASEPTDLAVLAISAPPVAVAGEPLALAARVKAVSGVPPAASTLTVRAATPAQAAADPPLATAPLAAADPTAIATVGVTFTPAMAQPPQPAERLAVELAGIPGEAIPVVNNRREFVVTVRPEPVRVLLLDAVPRWETRFAINTLERMPFVELNAIVASTRPQGQLVRGVQRGTWPADAATLGLYSVVFLGQLPDDLLSSVEHEAIARWVRESGGTLVELAPARCPIPVAEWQVRLTTLGLAHPLTRRLPASALDAADALDAAAAQGAAGPAALSGQTPLLVTLDPAGGPPVPLVSVGRDGAGKRAWIASDELWRVLNPRSLAAHTALFSELVTWAAVAAAPTTAPEAELRVATSREAIPVVLPPTAFAATVEVLRGDEVVARLPARDGGLVVPPQPAGTLRLRLAGGDSVSLPVEVVADDPEQGLLARDDEWLAALALRTGGRTAALVDLPRLVRSIPPRAHVERQERVWRPWNSGWTVPLLAGLLILEWVWRKWEGLV
jgi:hypothetical protein